MTPRKPRARRPGAFKLYGDVVARALEEEAGFTRRVDIQPALLSSYYAARLSRWLDRAARWAGEGKR